VLVADDHPVFRNGLGALIRDAPATELVGVAGDGQEAVDLARRAQPDVVLMDVRMPGLNGIDATAAIVSESPRTGVVRSSRLRPARRSWAPGSRIASRSSSARRLRPSPSPT
jgi:DNA-binding NarL/FixJ family response regulator